MNKDIDNLFKEALKNRSCEPPAYIWENISNKLNARKKKKRMIAWWYSTAAIMILLLSLTCLLPLRTGNNTMIPLVATSLPEWQPTTPAMAVVLTESPDLSDVDISPDYTIKQANRLQKDTPAEIQKNDMGYIVSPTTPVHTLKNNHIRTDFIPLINKRSIENNKLYQKILLSDHAIKNIESKPEKEALAISLSGHFAPGYASGNYNTPKNSPKAYSYSGSQTSGVFNISGGLKVTFRSNKRLSLQTGVMYTQMGQQTNNQQVYIPRNNITGVQGYAGSNVIASPLGRIKNNSRSLVYQMDSPVLLSNGKSNTGDIEQMFGAIEIPFSVKYILNNNKVKFSVLGGFSGSLIVNNKAYLNHDKKRELLGSTDNIRNFNVSTDLGIGVECPLTSKIKLLFEPGFRYYLQSISREESIDFKPFMFSFSTGIGIDF